MLAQFDGLVAGYQMRHRVEPAAIPFMSRRDFIFLNGNGELYDLIARQPQMPALAKLAPHELYMHVALSGRCSALVTISRTAPLPLCTAGHSSLVDVWVLDLASSFLCFSARCLQFGRATQSMYGI